tara:strand:+ start:165 stop:557 length:393 start_codon:yes stop_codon:yes gene_type:complete
MHSEFTGLIRLLNGEEIIGKVLVCEHENGFVIETPFSVEETILETPAGELVKVDLRPWAKFSKEEIFFIEKEKTVTVYEADSRIEKIYERTLRKYLFQEETSKLDLTQEMGFKTKIKDARKALEDLFNKS